MYIKTNGIVLRETEYKDSDKLLTVLTRDLGKRTFRARGVKSGRSRLKSACQLFAYSEFTVLETHERCVITEAVTQEMFPELRQDIELLSLASYFVQLTDTVAQEGDEMSELLSLLLNALYALAKLKRPQKLVKAVFELRLMCLAGFAPQLDRCTDCGSHTPEKPRLSLYGGGVHCPGCAPGAPGKSVLLCGASLAAMRHVCSAGEKKIFSFTLDESSDERFCTACEEYTLAQLDRGFGTLDYWHSLQNR